MVLDPFCSCATIRVAAEKPGVGIDLSSKAGELVKGRMMRGTPLFDRFDPIVRTDVSKRTELGELPPN